MINVGAMVATMTLDTKAFTLGMQKTMKAMKPLQTRMAVIGKTVKKFARQIINLKTAFLALGVAMAGRQIMGQFQRFQTALVDMGKVTSRNLQQIRKEVMNLSPAIGTATDLMAGYYQVISAGVKGAVKQIDTLVVSSKAAIAAHVSQAEVIKGLTAIVDAYEGKVKDAAEAADILFTIERLGKTTVAELIPVIGSLASLSATLSVSQDELGGSLAQITKFIGSTAEAATQLKALYTALITPTDELNALFEEQGGVIKAIKEIGFIEVLKRMDAATRGNVEALKRLMEGRREALLGFLSLSKQGFVPVTLNIEEMTKKMGAANRAFKEWKKTLEAVYAIFRATIGRVMIEIGQKLAPSVISAITDISKALEKHKDDIVDTVDVIVGIFGKWFKIVKDLWTLLSAFPVGVIEQIRNMGIAAEETAEKIERIKPPEPTTWQRFVDFFLQWSRNMGDVFVFIAKVAGSSFALIVGDAIETAKLIAKQFWNAAEIISNVLIFQFDAAKESWKDFVGAGEEFNARLKVNWLAWMMSIDDAWGKMVRSMKGKVEEELETIEAPKIRMDIPTVGLKDVIVAMEKTDEEIRALFQSTLEWERDQQSESLKEILEERIRIEQDAATERKAVHIAELREQAERAIKNEQTITEAYVEEAKRRAAIEYPPPFDWEQFLPPPEIAEAIEEVTIEQLTAVRNMYEDMGSYSAEYYDTVRKLIDEQEKAYVELTKNEVLAREWAENEKKKLYDAEVNMHLDMLKQQMNDLATFFEYLSEENRKYFKWFKRMAIAAAIIDTIQSAIKSYNWAAGWGGPIAGAIAAGIASLAGFARVAKIEAQTYAIGGWLEKHPRGGKIEEGTGERDDVFLGATPGVRHWGMRDEFVMNKKAAKKYGSLLEAMNEGLAGGGWLDKGYGIGIGDVLGGFVDLLTLKPVWKQFVPTPAKPAEAAIEDPTEYFDKVVYDMEVMLGKWSEMQQQYVSLAKQTADYIKRLKELGATTEQVTTAEEMRSEVLRDFWKQQKTEFLEPLEAIIVKGTLTDLGFQLYQINEWYEAQALIAKELGLTFDTLDDAFDILKTSIEKSFTDPLEDIVAKGTLTDVGYQIYQLDKWYLAQKQIAEELGFSLDLLQSAYEIQLTDITQTADAMEDMSEKATIMEGIRRSIGEMLGEFSELDIAIYSADRQFDAWIDTLLDMNATTEDLAEIEGKRAEVIAHLTKVQKEAWEAESLARIKGIVAIGEEVKDSLTTFTDFELQVNSIKDRFKDWKLQLEDLDADTWSMNKVMEKQDVAIANLIKTIKTGVWDEAGESIKNMTDDTLSFQKEINDLDQQFGDWRKTLVEVGASTQELIQFDNLWNAALIDLSNIQKKAITEAYDPIKHSISEMLGEVSELDAEIYSTNETFKGWKDTLDDLGASQTVLNNVEEKRKAVITKITQDFADLAQEEADALQEETQARLESIKTIMDGIQDTYAVLTPFQQQMKSIEDRFKDATDQLLELEAAQWKLVKVETWRKQAIKDLVSAEKKAMGIDVAQRLARFQLPGQQFQQITLLKEFADLIENVKEWSDVTGEGYEGLISQTKDLYKLELEAAIAQGEAADTMKDSIEDWQNVSESLDRTIFDLKTSLASPANVLERMAVVMQEITGFGAVEMPEQALELQDLWTTYLDLAKEAYQRPSTEYQAIYNTVIAALEGLEEQAEGFVSAYEINLDQLTVQNAMLDDLDIIASKIMSGVPVIVDWSYVPEAQHGGIFTGPESGYPVMLHGIEEVRPLGGANEGSQFVMNLTINESRTPRETGREATRQVEGFLKSAKGRKMVQQTAIGRA